MVIYFAFFVLMPIYSKLDKTKTPPGEDHLPWIGATHCCCSQRRCSRCPVPSWLPDPAVPLQPAGVDVGDQASLQRGAALYVNYCLGCHSLQYVRYNTLAQGLGLTEEQVADNLQFTGERPHDPMRIAMPASDAAGWFGLAPPDLSLIARARGSDWVYTFLKSFYRDPTSRTTGANNTVLEGAAMPHVLWELQGVQEAVYRERRAQARGL
jgi:cytochrome c1